jgi:hypothetical protein
VPPPDLARRARRKNIPLVMRTKMKLEAMTFFQAEHLAPSGVLADDVCHTMGEDAPIVSRCSRHQGVYRTERGCLRMEWQMPMGWTCRFFWWQDEPRSGVYSSESHRSICRARYTWLNDLGDTSRLHTIESPPRFYRSDSPELGALGIGEKVPLWMHTAKQVLEDGADVCNSESDSENEDHGAVLSRDVYVSDSS